MCIRDRYYDMLSGGDILNGEVLPPRVGLRTGIRAIYEFVEDKEELFLQFVLGIGCRRDTAFENIDRAIRQSLLNLQIDIRCV